MSVESGTLGTLGTSNIRIAFCSFLIVAVSWIWAPSIAHSQEAQLCITESLEPDNGKTPGEDDLEIDSKSADAIIQKVAKSIGLTRSFKVISCGYINKAQAFHVDSSIQGLPPGDYIIYDPIWVREVLGDDNTQAIAIFGHELAHILNDDFNPENKAARREKETAADGFSGCAVARLGGRWERLEDILKRIRAHESDNYPGRAESIAVAKTRFLECGGKILKSCRLPSHGIEGWQFEKDVSKTSNWRGGGGSQPGYCAELTAELRADYPSAEQFDFVTSSERIRDTCKPLNCIQYQYDCTIRVRGEPIYKLVESVECK